MKKKIYFTIIGIVALVYGPISTRSQNMTENSKYIKQTKARIKEFYREMEPERLRESYMALENVNPALEHDLKIRSYFRASCLVLWLDLIQIIDDHLDSSFNAEDVPENLVQPPPTEGGVVYPPGADPAVIKDSKARAAYKKAIADNLKKINNYRLQMNLVRLNERISSRAEGFIRNNYSPSSTDQAELKIAVEKEIKSPQRKAGLLKM